MTSVTVDQMPRRQFIVYDKRSEVITQHKVHWWEIWNAGRRASCLPTLDPKDRIGSRVWRVELRAGKEHLKERWAISKWAELDTSSVTYSRRPCARCATPNRAPTAIARAGPATRSGTR
jgi:hypothetical protein